MSKRKIIRFMATAWLSLISAGAVYGQTDQPLPLATGSSQERTLKGGEQHRYQLTLASDAYLNLTVAYQGLSTDVTLNEPNGQPFAERRSDTTTLGSVQIAFIAPAAGNYQLVVRGRTGSSAGKYTVVINTWRAATEVDRQYTAAHRLTAEGATLIALRTAEGRRQGLAKFRAALPLWRAIEDLPQELEVLRLIADTQFVLGELRPALEAAQEMLTKARAAQLRYWELKGLKYVGALHNSLNDYPAARQTLEQALVISRELRERLEERALLNSLGIAVAALGQRHAAIGYYQQALVIAREIGDRSGEATMLKNLGTRYESIGEPVQAVEHYQQALALRRELGLRDAEATTLLDLSRVQFRQGELQQALDLAGQSLTLLRAAGRKNDEANVLEHLGRVHYAMHEFELAAEMVNQALAFYRSNEHHGKEATCLTLLSAIYRSQGEITEADKLLQQALALHRRLSSPYELMGGLREFGSASLKQGQPQQALVHLSESLALSRQISDLPGETQATLQSGRAYRLLGEADQAKALLQRALTLSRTIKNRLLEAEAEHDLARLALQQEQYNEAQTHSEAALNIAENSRSSLVNPATRAEYRSGRQSYYETYLETLLRRRAQTGDERLTAQALETVERARARSLLEMLAEARIDIRQGVKTELLTQERTLQQRLAAKAELLQQLSTQKNGQEQAKILEAEMVTLTGELRAVESHIRSASPAYAALTQPQPLKLAEIQQQVLDRDTLLLEYALGTERSYLFAVTPTTLKVFTLPKRADIEAAAQQFAAALRRRGQAPAFPSLTARQQWLSQLERETATAAEALSRLILQPVAAELAHKRLLLVPDGVLHYVPFAALPEPVVGGRWAVVGEKPNQPPATSHQPLIVNHELITLPSASTLAVLRRELAGRTPAPKTLAVLADPVFSATDERVRSPLALATTTTRAAAAPAQRDRARQAFDAVSGQGGMLRLPASRTEAEAILALVPASERKAALDFAANQTLAQSQELGQYRYVHWATHGLLNTTQPELSGLMLSLVNEAGQSQPGFLSAQEVFQLKLPAELVVLSGCQTALGKEVNGEGLIGLTRGFMYAGARRVIASLWQVNDEATAELMKHLYQEMLGNRKLAPAAALRAAQIKLWRGDPRWRSPYYWAGFVLQGER